MWALAPRNWTVHGDIQGLEGPSPRSDRQRIGSERNRLVHEDFASYTLEKTTDEIYEAYRKGMTFLEVVPAKLRSYSVKAT